MAVAVFSTLASVCAPRSPSLQAWAGLEDPEFTGNGGGDSLGACWPWDFIVRSRPNIHQPTPRTLLRVLFELSLRFQEFGHHS
jgi:hypothetical protein